MSATPNASAYERFITKVHGGRAPCDPALSARLDCIQTLLLEAQTQAIKVNDAHRQRVIERMLKEIEDT